MKHFACLDGAQVSVNYDGIRATFYVFGKGCSAVLTDGSAKELRDWLNAKYPVEAQVAQCCEPTAKELEALNSGAFTPEELWGGSRPTCPKCVHGEELRAAHGDKPK